MDYDSMSEIQSAIIRTVAFFDVLDYAPTWTECCSWLEWSEGDGLERRAAPDAGALIKAREELVARGELEFGFGRVALAGRLGRLASLAFERTALFPRKVRRARRVARWLARFSAVRFVALVNTTALANARDNSDLDFFVIVRHGAIWTTRLLSVFPFRLFGRLANAGAKPDAVCFSYFISDKDYSLQSHLLRPDDPYFHYWFLSMLPLYDDGVSADIWKANAEIVSRHPFALPWTVSPDLEVRAPRFRFSFVPFFESFARRIQMAWFPLRITDRMNRDTSVMVSDSVLKFHVDDKREAYRKAYQDIINGR